MVGNEEPELDPLQKETQREIRQNLNIIATGWVEEVRPYYAIANALVFLSYREGFPNVVLQAGAMQLPSIVTDINGSNEIIIDKKNGLIIPVKNSKALEKSMQKLYTDTVLCKELTCNARELITARFEQQVIWEALLAEYKSLLKSVT